MKKKIKLFYYILYEDRVVDICGCGNIHHKNLTITNKIIFHITIDIKKQIYYFEDKSKIFF